jgi:hypothetical protein
MSTSSFSHTTDTVELDFRARQDHHLAQTRTLADGAVQITPATESMKIQAGFESTSGEEVRMALQKLRNEGVKVGFRNNKFILSLNDIGHISTQLEQDHRSSVRSVGRVLVGKPERTKAVCVDGLRKFMEQSATADGADVPVVAAEIPDRHSDIH